MPLTGLEVYKLLPKKNCRECGPPSCLAFAMQVASGKASPDACPYLSTEARERLAMASEPPIRTVVAGSGKSRIQMGGETVLFRHEKRFVSPPPLFIDLGAPGDDISRRAAGIASLRFERVGQSYRPEGIAVRVEDENGLARAISAAEQNGIALLIWTDAPGVLFELRHSLAQVKPVVGVARPENIEQFAQIIQTVKCPLVIAGQGVEDTARLAETASRFGIRDLILDFGGGPLREVVSRLVRARYLSLKQGQRALGYPALVSVSTAGALGVLEAVVLVARYAGAIVMPELPREALLALLTWRHDLYSDPERPVQVQSKLYSVGEAGPDSPVYITTNFSLTYYSVENEVAASRIPSYILPVDTDGTSVLTAWAAGKFTAEKVARALLESGAENASRRKLAVLPGYVGQIARKLRELSGWEVVVGPQEASGIPRFASSLLR